MRMKLKKLTVFYQGFKHEHVRGCWAHELLMILEVNKMWSNYCCEGFPEFFRPTPKKKSAYYIIFSYNFILT